MSKLEMWTNNTDTIICYGKDDIVPLYREFYQDAEQAQDELDNDEWRRIPDDALFMMVQELDEPNQINDTYPDNMIVAPHPKNEWQMHVVKLVRDWLDEGRGLLASTEY